MPLLYLCYCLSVSFLESLLESWRSIQADTDNSNLVSWWNSQNQSNFGKLSDWFIKVQNETKKDVYSLKYYLKAKKRLTSTIDILDLWFTDECIGCTFPNQNARNRWQFWKVCKCLLILSFVPKKQNWSISHLLERRDWKLPTFGQNVWCQSQY